MKIFFVALLGNMLFGTIPVFAGLADGKITITGNGVAQTAPEYARLTVQVISTCYDSSRDAKDANAKLANEVLAVLRTFAGNDEQLSAEPGANVRQNEYIYDGESTRLLCERKWRATNTLRIKLQNIEAIPDLQDHVLSLIDAQGTQQGLEQTYGTLEQAEFLISPETRTSLRAQAQKAAWVDAKAQFETFSAACPFQNVRLQSITEPTYHEMQTQRMDRPAMSETSTPVVPANISVSAEWVFVWTFDPTPGCKALSL